MRASPPCPECGTPLTSSTRRSHKQLQCPARVATPMPTCANAASACTKPVPYTKGYKRAYCSRACAKEADNLRRALAHQDPVCTTELREEQHMAVIRRREQEASAEVERTAAAVLAGQERRDSLMLELLGVPT